MRDEDFLIKLELNNEQVATLSSTVRIISNEESRLIAKRQILIMACVSVMVSWILPVLKAKEKTKTSLHRFNTVAAPSGTMWSFQPNGWMMDER